MLFNIAANRFRPAFSHNNNHSCSYSVNLISRHQQGQFYGQSSENILRLVYHFARKIPIEINATYFRPHSGFPWKAMQMRTERRGRKMIF
jgi:hypothetical protein